MIFPQYLGRQKQCLNFIFPNPATDLIAIQVNGLAKADLDLMDVSGKVISSARIEKGSTIAYFDVQAVYEGTYLVKISSNGNSSVRRVLVIRD